MKTVLVFLFAFCKIASAQEAFTVTTDKTTSLVFPFSIKHVDRGSKDILVQHVKENDQVLLIKAASKNFPETNLSVITSDGNVYSFLVSYEEQPKIFLIPLQVKSKGSIEAYANAIIDNKPTIKQLKIKRHGMVMAVTGVYVKDNVLYCQLLLCNHSPIDYDIDLLRFFTRDQKKAKRTALQEKECTPLYIAGNSKVVKAYNFSSLVIALDKFTIPDAKFFGVQIQERNGGRHFLLKVRNQLIMNAVILPDLR